MYKNLEPVSLSKHGRMKVVPSQSYAFASGLMLSELVAAELAHATLHFPLAFTLQGDQTGFAALLSILPGRNLYVAPNGLWIAGYVPATLRAYPFLGGQSENGQTLLFIDAGSGLLSEKDGQELFTAEKAPSPMLEKVMGFLAEVEQNRVMTRAACSVLHHLKLLVPWDIKISGENGTTSLEGLYQVDEQAMNSLSHDEFTTLRESGALPLAYAQLLSMGRLESLANLARQQVQSSAKNQKLLGQCFNLGRTDNNSFKF